MMKRKPATRTAPAAKASPLKTAFNYASIFVLAGVFVLGIGIGIAFSSTTITDTRNVASREFIDRAAPNADLCVQYGASAMVMDTRLFVSLNPFNVYVSQPSMRPGCVLRTNNFRLLEERRLVTNEQVRDCKNRMNTFGFTGDLGNSPEINCVYQNDGAKNFYLTQSGAAPSQTEQF
jgi:Protein of unknown function (DUF3172)